MRRLMLSVIEPAAETYWDAVGWIIDSTGVHHFTPESDEEWERVEAAGWMLVESEHLLLVAGREGNAPVGDGSWRAMAASLGVVSMAAVEAAGARDPDAVFDAGAELYQACLACHAAFAAETLRPNYAEDSSGAAPSPAESR